MLVSVPFGKLGDNTFLTRLDAVRLQDGHGIHGAYDRFIIVVTIQGRLDLQVAGLCFAPP